MDDLAVYAGLFAVAFAAATILPMQSEAALAGLLLTESFPAAPLVLVASAGNILSSAANWLIGRGVERFRTRKWFPASPEMLDRATKWYHRYGRWSLLLSWVPVVGDPLTVVAGILREPLWSFLVIVAVAKIARYLVVAAITLSWI
ncbi:MAG: DedA family protein [Mesorhizobium sp.]|uniref:YqaA family protein n=1 Tax=Mesorhizobium sp. TaxID=1871066 RepID=UPI000FEA2084|nr:YqaA family protein [Mesorhizobium sp.]RWH82144.1 MAG: DedA family protein [Mesorhizobium sp.]RWH85145.1 MAG: DedA family protein [Mesorhizobium sp.]RWH89900.1 MAG: DedA family protein [Mesorhizobium sp.]RWH98351.1 MAG: DedA family protein [Mesorhizobium sp.]RWI04642.1 MAG: DedA family protein [Mesorhizobium sp.]